MSESPTNGNGTTARWQLIASIAGIGLLVGGALYGYISTTASTNLQVAANTTKLADITAQYNLLVDRIQTIRSEQATRGGDLKGMQRDLVNLSGDVRSNTDRQSALAAQAAKMESSLGIVEAQLCAESQVRNLMHSKEEGQIATLWLLTQKIPLQGGNATYPLTGCFQSEGK